MSDPRGFEPTERRDDPNDTEPDATERMPDDDQADAGDYSDPRSDTDEEGRPTI